MAVRIAEVMHRSWPDEGHVRSALIPFALTPEKIASTIGACVHTPESYHRGGLQQFLASSLEHHLEMALTSADGLSSADDRYSPELNEKADFALAHDQSKPRVFFEVEFRPNVEKDLVKFQIGANRGTLAVAVLVLAAERSNINASYTTMPEYHKFERIIEELRPSYPLLLVGIRIANNAA
jgi:hypothetical protein